MIVELKKELRKKMMVIRDSIDENIRRKKDEKITSKLKELLIKKNINSILLYASYKSEVDTWRIFEFCKHNNIKTAFPKVNVKEHKLEIYWVESIEDFSIGFNSIPEPKIKTKAELNDIDLILVPAVAFDESCNRIGYGGGYYDRLLPMRNGDCIGLAYEEQIIDTLPVELHDIKVDLIITDKRVISCV